MSQQNYVPPEAGNQWAFGQECRWVTENSDWVAPQDVKLNF